MLAILPEAYRVKHADVDVSFSQGAMVMPPLRGSLQGAGTLQQRLGILHRALSLANKAVKIPIGAHGWPPPARR